MLKVDYLVEQKLLSMQDIEYQKFNSKLIPNINPETIIGVRTPKLRQYAKEFSKDPLSIEFLKLLPHKYYEENNLHAFIIELGKDYNEVIKQLNDFLPYVDNWACCDLMSPKIFKTHKAELKKQITIWLKSNETYTIRFGIEMLMVHFLDDDFFPVSMDWVAAIKSEEYYVNMMIAWYFATALAKQYDASLPYIVNNKLNIWTHNKTIQKAIESNRILLNTKDYLRKLRRKTQ